jgi:hypothetical protein
MYSEIVQCVLPAYTKPWLDRTNKRLFTVVGFSPERFSVSVFHVSEKFDSDLELDAWMHKTHAHPCPPMNNNIAPMPTQNPWVWVGMGMGMGMGTQCRALVAKPGLGDHHIPCSNRFMNGGSLFHEHPDMSMLVPDPPSYEGYRVLTFNSRGMRIHGQRCPPKTIYIATWTKKYLYMQILMFKNHGQVWKSWW